MSINWQQEHDYILAVSPSNPGSSFNYDRECFRTYCRMQADAAYEAKEWTIGLAIIHHGNKESN